MDKQQALLQYTLQLADNALILGHRNSEWCGHGPVLEQDIALINISLDQLGQCRNLFDYAATVEGKGRSEDDLAYVREEHEYVNVLLTERPNGHFGYTIIREMLFDNFQILLYDALLESSDQGIREIAEKSIEEIKYHVRFSSEWTIRLGDGTEESHAKMQSALEDLWPYTGELFMPSVVDEAACELGIAPDLKALEPLWRKRVDNVLQEANLKAPESVWYQKGGKQGVHTEHMGFILAQLQYMQRTYPNQKW